MEEEIVESDIVKRLNNPAAKVAYIFSSKYAAEIFRMRKETDYIHGLDTLSDWRSAHSVRPIYAMEAIQNPKTGLYVGAFIETQLGECLVEVKETKSPHTALAALANAVCKKYANRSPFFSSVMFDYAGKGTKQIYLFTDQNTKYDHNVGMYNLKAGYEKAGFNLGAAYALRAFKDYKSGKWNAAVLCGFTSEVCIDPGITYDSSREAISALMVLLKRNFLNTISNYAVWLQDQH